MTTSDVLKRFGVEHHDYHKISERRRRDQLAVLSRLESEVGRPLLQISDADLRSWYASDLEGRSPTTVGKHAKMIRVFYRWAGTARLLDFEDWTRIIAVPPPRGSAYRGEPRPYKPHEIKLFWRDFDRTYPLPEEHATDGYWFRRFEAGSSRWNRVRPFAERSQAKAIFALALMGGLRRREIFNLDDRRLHHENAYIVVLGAAKNRDAVPEERVVPWTTPELHQWVQEWIDFRAWLGPDHDSVWLSLWGEAHYLKPMQFRKFEMLANGVGKGYEFHRLRHTCATTLLRSGYPLESVMEVMGHSRIEQTLAYAAILKEDIIKVAARCSMQVSGLLNDREEV